MNKLPFFILILLLLPLINSTECPRGLINDSYPGDCKLYIDSDNNKICDYSEEISSEQLNTQNSNIKVNKMPYNITLITIVLIALYLGTYFLSKKNKISQVTHKKIWNFFLLITFIITSLTSIIFLLNFEYGTSIKTPFNLIFWHIEIGYMMILISIFHTLWHIPYFKTYLKIKKENQAS